MTESETFHSTNISPHLQWVVNKCKQFNTDLLLNNDLTGNIEQFFSTNTTRLFIFAEEGNLRIENQLPLKSRTDEVTYFVKLKNFPSEPLDGSINFGKISLRNPIKSLYEAMTSNYMQTLLQSNPFPERVKKDFAVHLQKFMASLTEVTYQSQGKTVLYVPNEDLSSLEKVANNKDLLQRLEAILIHWTRQIKQVISNKDNLEVSENAGPLEEIQFWKSRTEDLSGIRDQLENPKIKQIRNALELAKSSYLEPFSKLTELIQKGSAESVDNLSFLNALRDPCERLSQCDPQDIPEILPPILRSIRNIWSLSKHYNSSDRLTGLLRKVSNEIIKRCRAKVSLQDIFGSNSKPANFEKAIAALYHSIQAGESWKQQYNQTVESIVQGEQKESEWKVETSNVFAQVDAFAQRCKDLLDICEAQLQFLQSSNSSSKPSVQAFGGSQGPDITKRLREVEVNFEKLLHQLKTLEYDILDVRATHRWHDDYNNFKRGIKDIEVMMRNIINMSFEGISTVQSGVHLFEYFIHLAKRESIRRTLDKKIQELYGMFLDDLNKVKKEFDIGRTRPSIHSYYPRSSGAVAWAKAFLNRIKQQMNVLQSLSNLTQNYNFAMEVRNEAVNQFNAVTLSLEEYLRKVYKEWADNIEGNITKRLNTPIIAKVGSGDSNNSTNDVDKKYLVVNFDEGLLRLFSEIAIWQRMGFVQEIPAPVKEVIAFEERFRILRESVLLVTKDYNNILRSLTTEEQRLFKERVEFLEKKLEPGFSKLTWVSGDAVDQFVKECRHYATIVRNTITEFKTSYSKIQFNCTQISELLLVNIRKKRVYNHDEFEQRQQAHLNNIKEKWTNLNNEICNLVNSTFDTFKQDSPEIQIEWGHFVDKVDKMVETALRTCVKRSLLELSKSINGDRKSDVSPLFNVSVTLEMNRVELKPTLKDLADIIDRVSTQLIGTVSLIPRASLPFRSQSEKLQTFFDIISTDKDILEIFSSIRLGMSSQISDLVREYVMNWDKYKDLYDLDKEAYIRRYARYNRLTLEAFEADIADKQERQKQVENEETIKNIKYAKLDCSMLKYSLISHCNAWQNKLCNLLNQTASTELKSLYDFFADGEKQLKVLPRNLEMLKSSITLLEKINEDAPSIEARFEPLQKQYKALEKLEVPISEQDKQMLDNLPKVWADFRQMLQEVDEQIKTKKESFKSSLMQQADEFTKVAVSLREDFLNNMPKSTTVAHSAALDTINEFRTQINDLMQRENSLKQGMGIFNIEPPIYKELVITLKDLDNVEQVWQLREEWETTWESWKTVKFTDLNTQQMEETAQKFQKRIVKLGREIKHLQVWQDVKEKVDQFKVGMPLVQDLRNPAIRPRHWDQLKSEVGKSFDPDSYEFTLEQIFVLGLDSYADVIANLSSSATKELAIEDSLKSITEQWESVNLELIPHKDTEYYRLKTADEIYQILEDNQGSLSSMKSSRYYHAFEAQVEHWEKTLSHILETVEMILQVQRNWRYLENIFSGFEDIRKQLPTETSTFDKVNQNWKKIMDSLHEDPNALRGTHKEGLLETLMDMNLKLEKIQKSLDQYLETKRSFFPRFYFLSNDDLLEILGQSKEPLSVQAHLSKCFDNIKKLEFIKDPKRNRYEAKGMHSTEGEYVAFNDSVIAEGPVEQWLSVVENAMRATLKRELTKANIAFKKPNKDKWIVDTPGQLTIASSQINWTQEVAKSLKDIEGGEKTALRELRKKQGGTIKRLTEMVKKNITFITRLKLVALLTIEIHARDVIDRLAKANVDSESSFEWKRQLRYYWEKGEDEFVIRQTNSVFVYGYEYIGNSGRLVVTSLTERCYLTLTTALYLKRGGAPSGPAGTGKTETVKDLAKAMGKYVLIINCSESLNYKALGRSFSGLAQTGAWSCFDEFNRIETEVLSVVAQQVSAILNAIMEEKKRFIFEGTEIKLNPTCGIFITMNPGYAGRSILPDNLVSLFRPMAMMVPDLAQIAEIMLFSEGFSSAKFLSKKIVTLYDLATQQLSKQDHYDFTLRAIKSVLVTAGGLKRVDGEMPEDLVLLRALRDTNLPKFVGEDTQLFLAILGDLFPGAEPPEAFYGSLIVAIEEEFAVAKLQPHPELVKKIIQLYETKATRHGVMVVGQSGSGKSTCWKILQQALTRLKKQGSTTHNLVKTYVLNPKAITVDEMYGGYDKNTREWADGILAVIMRAACNDEKPDEKWVIFDGPVDTQWIESMNSVLDDNKVLTLANSERIYLTPQTLLLFETPDLSAASPATVSRCGMIYMSADLIGWRPFMESWINKQSKEHGDILRRLFDKHFQKALDYRRERCIELFKGTDLNTVASLCNLYESLATVENGVNSQDTDFFERMVELWYIFCLIWTVGATVVEDSRKDFDMLIREMDSQFPHKDTVYEYFVDPQKKGWSAWEDKIPPTWKYQPGTPMYKILVPTVDTIRNAFLVSALIKSGRNILLVGNTGTGKTAIIQHVLDQFQNETFSTFTINFSAQTSAQTIQEMIEERVEKRTKDVYVPIGGKKMITFIDDLNLPKKDTYGSQPPLELLRQWIDYGFWYDTAKQSEKRVKDMQLVCAMGPPGGGRSEISLRLQSRFHMLNITFPNEQQIKRIFGTLINQKLQDFEEDIKQLGDNITQATLDIYDSVIANLLPTPAKNHYVFNLRDMSKVFQGLLLANPDTFDNSEIMLRLWVHECFRIFYDRLVDERDRLWFKNLISEKLASLFGVTWQKLFKGSNSPSLFGDFLTEEAIYQELPQADNYSQIKQHIMSCIDEYNVEPGNVRMDLVLFKDAVDHVCRIHRILRQPRGNALLVGVGGSGRQSLSKLAAYMAGYTTFQIEIRKNFKETDFREKLKDLYNIAGVENKKTMFLFADTQIKNENFLEDVCNILGRGEVPNLYRAEDIATLREAIRQQESEKPVGTASLLNYPKDVFYEKFIERAWNNIHVVICMSPGDQFRNRCRMFPALVNCCTIDWFSEWPEDALKEVSMKFFEEKLDVANDVKLQIADFCVGSHISAVETSQKMTFELKREYVVTPTNYLQLVQNYISLLKEKRDQVKSSAEKLRSGLTKLDTTRQTVEEMSVSLEQTKVLVAKMQKECEEYLMEMVQKRQDANEKAKLVAAKSEKIAQEEVEVKEIASAAQSDLDKALPALDMAKKSLAALNKKDLAEVKAYTNPPPLVEKVMSAVMILRKADTSWGEAKKQLNDPNFLSELISYNIEKMTDAMLKKIERYCTDPEFQPEKVGKVSLASKSLCMWVRAMEKYGHIYREVAPKQQAVREAESNLLSKTKALTEATQKLKEVEEQVAQLKADYEQLVTKKDNYRAEAENTAIKLERAQKVVVGLASEKARWEKSITDYEIAFTNLPGDCLLAAAFLSYCGPLTSDYRSQLKNNWLKKVKQVGIPTSNDFNFPTFMASAVEIREWNLQGLPTDPFSNENGVLVTRTKLWPVMIDPQGQANKWIKNMEKNNGLKIITQNQHDFMRTLENAMHFGSPVLLQDVGEEVDPSLEPILAKSIVKVGNRTMIKLEEGKEVEYNPDFRFYITSKHRNPRFKPEIATKTTVTNFGVTEQGLEAQLLASVVRHQRRELEEQKDELVTSTAAKKKKLVELEDKILYLLNTAQKSLLDDEQLVNTLQSSKETAEEIKQQLVIAEQTEIKIDLARQAFLPCAIRSSTLFFVLNDLSLVDPMYQFSLESYSELFQLSLDKVPRSDDIQDTIKNLNEYHSLAVYKNTCRGLFEKHKLLFAFQMCIKIMESEKRINKEEYKFFLRGGQVLNKENQMPNPATDWLPEFVWDNITVLDHLANFRNIASSFEQNIREWREWYFKPEPETVPLPGEWENKCNELQHMIVVRCFRPDRVLSSITSFVSNNLDARFVDPPPFDLSATFDVSSPFIPLIFILSPGVDPRNNIRQLAEDKDMVQSLRTLALGQGQAQTAVRMIEEGIREGHWIFLANCHLMVSWLDTLEQIVDEIPSKKPHPNFRLWLSSNPHPKFPVSVLQRGIKITTEPPKGIKQNLQRLYNLITETTLNKSKVPQRFKKLLFSLCFFHSLLLERKKFLTLGWNKGYDFNDSDFLVSENLLCIYLDEYETVPWEAIKYLIADVNYGGRVTDKWDRRLLGVYSKKMFCPEAIATVNYRLSSMPTYYIPDDGPLHTYRDYVVSLPLHDKPEAFGQHSNADIASSIQDANYLLSTLVSLQPRTVAGPGDSREQKVQIIITDLSKKLSNEIVLSAENRSLLGNTPLRTVLEQEIYRYNQLLRLIRKSLTELQKGIKGLIVMSPELEEVLNYLYDSRVPPSWQKTYPSLKPLAPWVHDLVQRIEMLHNWAEGHVPQIFWLTGFTFPTGFLTALMQICARKNNVPIDSLAWEFIPVTEENPTEFPNPENGEGAYVSGLFLEGARWDNGLAEPNPMELYSSMPLVHFKPVEAKKKLIRDSKETYICPLYLYPVRDGSRERPSFMIAVELSSGSQKPDHWIKRGTALLLSTP